jgi:hypothetical protein
VEGSGCWEGGVFGGWEEGGVIEAGRCMGRDGLYGLFGPNFHFPIPDWQFWFEEGMILGRFWIYLGNMANNALGIESRQ